MRAIFLRCCAFVLVAGGILFFAGVVQARIAQAWFVSIDGSVSPLSEPLAGRVKIASGIGRGHWQFEGSLSFIPVEDFILYKGGSGNVDEDLKNYPVFLGLGSRYYIFSETPYARRHDMYMGGGLDFPIPSVGDSFLPGFSIGGGYALRLHRKIIMEMGIDYYFYGALTNEVFLGLGFKGVF